MQLRNDGTDEYTRLLESAVQVLIREYTAEYPDAVSDAANIIDPQILPEPDVASSSPPITLSETDSITTAGD